jgi:hypothetical protein
MPYMDRVGLDPAQFLPPSPEEGMVMAMYGGMPKAQNGITRIDPRQVMTQLERSKRDNFNNSRINNNPRVNTVTRTTPYTASDIEFKDGMWKVKPTADMQAAPFSISSNNMSPQRFQDLYFNDPQAGIDLVIKSSGIPSYIERVDKSKQEFLNNINKPFVKQQMDTIPPAPVQQNVVTQKARPATQTPKPKVNVTKPQNSSDSEWGDYEYGGNIPQYQIAGETPTEVAKPNPYAKVFIEERTSKTSGKKAFLYYEGDQKYLVDESGNEIPGTRKTRTADDIKFTQYGSPEIGTAIDERVKKGNKVIYTRIPAGQFANQPRLKNTGIYLPSADASARTEGTLSSAEWKDFQDRHGDWIEKEYPGGGFNKFKQDLETVDTDPDRLKNLETPGNKAAGWFQDKVNEKSIKATGKPYFKPKDPNSKDPYQRDIKFGRVTYSVPNYFDDEPVETPKEKPEENPQRDPLEAGQLNVNSLTPRGPIGFYPQDVLNTAAAVGDLASINKYNPRMVQFNAEPMKPTYYDPNRELANNAEMANMAAQQLAQFTGPQSFNARFSDVQGKGLANAANIEARYNNLNVGVANQFEQANAQLMNEANFRNQLAANDFYDKTVTANQQFDNSKRQGRRQVVDYTNAALENRFITDQMNSLYPNYFVDPAMLKTFYNKTQELPAKQRGQDLATYLKSAGIDITNPTVQAAMAKSLLGDVDVDERGEIVSAQAAMSQRRKRK